MEYVMCVTWLLNLAMSNISLCTYVLEKVEMIWG